MDGTRPRGALAFAHITPAAIPRPYENRRIFARRNGKCFPLAFRRCIVDFERTVSVQALG